MRLDARLVDIEAGVRQRVLAIAHAHPDVLAVQRPDAEFDGAVIARGRTEAALPGRGGVRHPQHRTRRGVRSIVRALDPPPDNWYNQLRMAIARTPALRDRSSSGCATGSSPAVRRAGEPLPSERVLADELGCNRHAVREAVKRLQQAGPRRGLARRRDARARLARDRRPGPARPAAAHRRRSPIALLRSILELRLCVGVDAARRCAAARSRGDDPDALAALAASATPRSSAPLRYAAALGPHHRRRRQPRLPPRLQQPARGPRSRRRAVARAVRAPRPATSRAARARRRDRRRRPRRRGRRRRRPAHRALAAPRSPPEAARWLRSSTTRSPPSSCCSPSRRSRSSSRATRRSSATSTKDTAHEPQHGDRQRRHQRRLEVRRARRLRRALRAHAAAHPDRRLVGLGAHLLRRRPRLLLVSPHQPRGARLLGQPRRPPLEPALQPLDRAAPDLGADDLPAVLAAARARRLPALDDPHPAGDQPHLPVLDPHRAHRPAAAPDRVRLQHAVAPPRPPRRQRAVPRPQLRAASSSSGTACSARSRARRSACATA